MIGRLVSRGVGASLRFERVLALRVERVWRAITEPDDLAAWFPGVPRFDPLEPGATFLVEGDAGGSGRIVELGAAGLVAFEWGDDELRFELEPDGDGCRLRFSHTFSDPATGARTAAGWEVCLDRLEAQLQGAPIDAREAMKRWPEVHEAYAAAFGLDPEVGRRAYAERSPGE
jgi:uncharacterized protein YndB with AHSA1/START domain